ncbi:MAG: hypothetical protein HOC71_05430, partial [Candidatus Latescibacteria bacterium]|nr:hypothetical protein [Candidatus Latescibacterota bacterium]
VVLWLCIAGSDQIAIQRFLSTRDIKAARKSFKTTMYAIAGINLVLMFVGFALINYYRTYPHFIPDGKNLVADVDFLFPHFIVSYLPVGITGLVIVGLVAAAMSSLSSGINSTAAVIVTDIVPYVRKKMNERKNNVSFTRLISLIIGILVVIASSLVGKVPGNIMEVTGKTVNLFQAPLFNLFFMAIFVPFATPLGTIAGVFYGLTVAVLISFWDVLTGNPGFSFLWIMPIPLAVGIIFGIIFSFIPSRGKKMSTQLAWFAGMILPLIVITALVLKLA